MEKQGKIIILLTIIICLIIGFIIGYYISQAPEVSKALFGEKIGETIALIGIFFLLLGIILGVIFLVKKTGDNKNYFFSGYNSIII